MALKDWKRKKLKSGRLLYISKEKAIGIQFSPRGIATTPYVVDIMDRLNHSKIISLNYFKTRPQALKFARNYMKKH